MQELTEMPLSGQFISVHEYDGAIWSTTLRWGEDGDLETYIDGKDEFMDMEYTQNDELRYTYFKLPTT